MNCKSIVLRSEGYYKTKIKNYVYKGCPFNVRLTRISFTYFFFTKMYFAKFNVCTCINRQCNTNISDVIEQSDILELNYYLL